MTTRARAAHAGKSEAERRQYVENVTRPTIAPTLDVPPARDATNSVSGDREANVSPVATKARKKRSREPRKWPLLPGVVGTVVVLYAGFLGKQAFDFNREIGEMRQELKRLDEQVTGMRAVIADVDGRAAREVERVERELERAQGQKPHH